MHELFKFLRYGGVGVTATISHYAVLIGAVELGHVPAPAASAFGALFGAAVAYAGNRHFTFGTGASHTKAAPRFALVAILGATAGAGVVAAAMSAGWPYLAGQVLATVLVLVLGFLLNRFWTFA